MKKIFLNFFLKDLMTDSIIRKQNGKFREQKGIGIQNSLQKGIGIVQTLFILKAVIFKNIKIFPYIFFPIVNFRYIQFTLQRCGSTSHYHCKYRKSPFITLHPLSIKQGKHNTGGYTKMSITYIRQIHNTSIEYPPPFHSYLF